MPPDRGALLAHVREVINRAEVDVERAIVFGSVARGDHSESSDVDVILVSPDFEGVPGAHRGRPFREVWTYERYGSVDFIEYTPREYREYRNDGDGLIQKAEEQGVRVV